LGFLLARGTFKGRDFLNSCLMLPFVLPPTVLGFSLLELLGRNGALGSLLYKCFHYSAIFTWHACVIASFVVALPIMISTSRAAFETVDIDLEKVSYTLGHSRWHTFVNITLPLAAKGLAAGLVLTFARAIGEFGATLIVAGNIPSRTQTMPLAIYEAVQTNQESLALTLVALLATLSVIVLYFTYKLGRRWY
jgi:molybdate transport system permease protein